MQQNDTQLEEVIAKAMNLNKKIGNKLVSMQIKASQRQYQEVYALGFEAVNLAEKQSLLCRSIPCYTGHPAAMVDLQTLLQNLVPIELGFTVQGWFVLRMPLLLPKKEKGSDEYIRSILYPSMRRFFEEKASKRFERCVLIFRHVYDQNRPEREYRDHDIMEKQIDNASDPFQIYMMVNNPYGLTFLKYAEPYLSQEDYTHILGSAWVMCEAPHNNPDLGISKLIAMFQKADPALLMDEGEYATYLAMEDTVTVYRGVTPHNAKNIRALSWTTNRETAEWFAHRFGEEGTVYEAQIDKAHIFAYLSDRNEAEVILNPRYLSDITEAQDMASDFSLSQ